MNSSPTPDGELLLLERAVRVGDQSCTCYAILRDRFRLRSTLLDVAILLISAWLSAMVFVQPAIAELLTPFALSKDLWLGMLSIGAFALSLVQLQVNWKGRAQAYGQACVSLSAFVKEGRGILAAGDVPRARSALARHHAVAEALEPIPDSQFLSLKRQHLVKVELSRQLDRSPGMSLLLMRLALWVRDSRAALWGEKKE